MPTGPNHLLGAASRAGSYRQHVYLVFGLYTFDLRWNLAMATRWGNLQSYRRSIRRVLLRDRQARRIFSVRLLASRWPFKAVWGRSSVRPQTNGLPRHQRLTQSLARGFGANGTSQSLREIAGAISTPE